MRVQVARKDIVSGREDNLPRHSIQGGVHHNPVICAVQLITCTAKLPVRQDARTAKVPVRQDKLSV
jgi:hypothetical protein